MSREELQKKLVLLRERVRKYLLVIKCEEHDYLNLTTMIELEERFRSQR